VLVHDGASPPWKEDEAEDRKETRAAKRQVIRAAQERLQEMREEQARFAQWRDSRQTCELVAPSPEPGAPTTTTTDSTPSSIAYMEMEPGAPALMESGASATAESSIESVVAPVTLSEDGARSNFSMTDDNQEDEFTPEEHRRFASYDVTLFLAEVREAEQAYDKAVKSNIICRRSDYELLSQLGACMHIQSITGELEADYVLGSLARGVRGVKTRTRSQALLVFSPSTPPDEVSAASSSPETPQISQLYCPVSEGSREQACASAHANG
jgi:hypothetical protein